MMIVSPDSSSVGGAANNGHQMIVSPLRSVRIQVQECSQSQPPPAQNVIHNNLPNTTSNNNHNLKSTIIQSVSNNGVIKAGPDVISYHPTQYPHIQVASNHCNNNNNNNISNGYVPNNKMILHQSNPTNLQEYTSNHTKSITSMTTSASVEPQIKSQYPVMDTTVASSTIKGEPDLNIGN